MDLQLSRLAGQQSDSIDIIRTKMKSTIGSGGSWRRLSPNEPRIWSADPPVESPVVKMLNRRSRNEGRLDARLKLRRSLLSGLICTQTTDQRALQHE